MDFMHQFNHCKVLNFKYRNFVSSVVLKYIRLNVTQTIHGVLHIGSPSKVKIFFCELFQINTSKVIGLK